MVASEREVQETQNKIKRQSPTDLVHSEKSVGCVIVNNLKGDSPLRLPYNSKISFLCKITDKTTKSHMSFVILHFHNEKVFKEREKTSHHNVIIILLYFHV